MQNASKYGIQYFAPENPPMRWARRDHIERAPILVLAAAAKSSAVIQPLI